MNRDGTIETADILSRYYSTAKWSSIGENYSDLTWSEDNKIKKPTEAEIESKKLEFKAEYDAQEYARNRATAYDSIGNQLDMQYHDLLNGTTTWKDAIAKVKADNPKE